MSRLLALFFLAALIGTLSLGAAPAQADHCQPEELAGRAVLGPTFNSPLQDSADPRCYVAAALSCENQADPADCARGIAGSLAQTTDRDQENPEWVLACSRAVSGLGEPRKSIELVLCTVLGHNTYKPGSYAGP
jgi:hypothetical protein